MKPGDVARFRVAEKEYYLTLTRLQNFLIGDDFAEFEVTTTPPSAERVHAIRKAAQPPVPPESPQEGDQGEE
jgi:hypothetical protein